MEQKINLITMSSVFINAKRIYDDDTVAGSSTMSGFLWAHKDSSYIITNWHNVTGQNPDTGEYIGHFTPDRFFVKFKYRLPSELKGQKAVLERDIEIKLYDDDLNKIWFEHPDGGKIDVVAIPIDLKLLKDAEVCYLNKQHFEDRWQPEIGDDCFIIGYPEGISGPWNTPIWKRGSVATPPLLDYNEMPVFLLDTIGNSGLSGAPVIGRGHGVFNPGSREDISLNSIIGSWSNFVGIYAGRLSKCGIGSQLGRVWKKSVIDQIFKHQDLI